MDKPKREVNLELLKAYLDKPCFICGLLPSVAHHLKSKGSGGPDKIWNLIPLCKKHHTEIHKIGFVEMFFTRHPGLMPKLNKVGWSFVSIGNSLKRYTLRHTDEVIDEREKS